jgi:bifunctional UDP-N-acetylglucosamine pyrophosphorylase / glucosamine-1-phosphate N-acetyltransferase
MSTHTTPPRRPLAVVVLAAGKGTRMKSELPKVVHPVLGRPVVGWVLAAAETLGAERTIVVVGHGADAVREVLPAGVRTAVQEQQRGSGDAVAAALPELEGFEGDVLVVNGDGALFQAATLDAVVEQHAAAASHASALAIRSTQDLPYGRIISGHDGSIERIVEAVDATPTELAVRDLNAGVYCFDAAALAGACPRLSADNAKGEYYITDLIGLIGGDGGATRAVLAGDEDELLGINTRADLAVVESLLQARINEAHMAAGVTISLPQTCLIEPTVQLEPDAHVAPGTILRGATTVAAGAVVGPYSVLTDTHVAAGASVVQSTCVSAQVGTGASVGPYGYLRPGAVLSQGSKVGTFVELKNTTLGAGSKVPHLSYIGDATVGAGSNIGAGNITANYRPELGSGKQRTTIGARVRTGSDNVLVAPVTLGDDSFTGAGSIIVQDVPARALAIARARQVNLQDYADRLVGPDSNAKETSGDRADRNVPGSIGSRGGISDHRG